MISNINNYRLFSQLTRQNINFFGNPNILRRKANKFLKKYEKTDKLIYNRKAHLLLNLLVQVLPSTTVYVDLKPMSIQCENSFLQAIMKKLYLDSLELITYLLEKRTLVNPPPLEECCTNIFFLGYAGVKKLGKFYKNHKTDKLNF
jgi:hypothetical protein